MAGSESGSQGDGSTRSQGARGNTMTDNTPKPQEVALGPLWTDEDIANDAKRADSNPTVQAKIRACLAFMRHGYEAALYELHHDVMVREKHVAKLEAQLAEANDIIAGLEFDQDSPEYVARVEDILRNWGKDEL